MTCHVVANMAEHDGCKWLGAWLRVVDVVMMSKLCVVRSVMVVAQRVGGAGVC